MVGPERAARGLECLRSVRDRSAALRLVLLPDAIWGEYRAHCTRRDSSCHQSILLNAFQRGCLDRITGPVDRYLIGDGRIRPDVSQQYLSDLRETWILADDPIARHRQATMFCGRLSELQLAEWLEQQGAKVLGLEAWGAPSDIEFRDSLGRHCVVEAKYIGQETAVFEALLAAREGRRCGFWHGIYDACDYLLIRAFEAAVQLEGMGGCRVACLALSNEAVDLYTDLKEMGWINWRSPVLSLKGQTEGMRDLVTRLRARHPRFEEELQPRLEAMAEVWIVGIDPSYAFSWVERVRPGCSRSVRS